MGDLCTNHSLYLFKTHLYKCKHCDFEHICGDEKLCDHIYYNGDHTAVCSLTGETFGQRQVLGHNVYEAQEYTHHIPRKYDPLQFREGNVQKVLQLFHSQGLTLSPRIRRELISAYRIIWEQIKVHISNTRNVFVAIFTSIIYHLHVGITCVKGGGYIIYPHPKIKKGTLNMVRVKNNIVKVKYVRYGYNLLRQYCTKTSISPIQLI